MKVRATLLGSLVVGTLATLSISACSGGNKAPGFTEVDAGDNGFLGGDADAPCVPTPGAYDFPNNNCDDDADGKVDNPPPACDASLSVGAGAADFAKAIGLCQTSTGDSWGVVSAVYANGYARTDPPNDGQHGILKRFGSVLTPREGGAMGVISTGFAREFDEPTGTKTNFKVDGKPMQDGVFGRVPPGFPKAAQGCSIDNAVFDTMVVKLTLKAPMNAKGIAFDFNFHSGEWPEFVCTNYNDGFIAYLKSKAFNGGAADNMSFDAKGNPVSVNNGFFDRCTPGIQTGRSPLAQGVVKTSECSGGPGELAGTGFGQPLGQFPAGNGQSTPGGATGWLTSTAPVEPGETFEISFIIWDTGDPNYDSSALIDNFRWVQGATQTGTVRPPK